MTNNEFVDSFNALEIAFGNREDFAKISSQARALLSESVAGELHEYRCKLWLILAESLRISGKSAEALTAAQQAVGLLSEISSEAQFHLAPKAHGILALNYKAKGDKEQTMVQFELAIAAARRHSNREALGIWSGNFGHFYNQTSEAARAIDYYRTALEVYEELGNLAQISHWNGCIGTAQVDLSDFPQALESYQRAMKIAEELDDKQLVANHSGNLGGLYWNISDYPQAIAYFQKALNHARDTNNTREMSKWLGNMGIIYGDLEDYPKALDYFKQAFTIDEESNSLPGKAMWLGNIGIVHKYLKDYSTSLETLHQAMQIDEVLGNKAGVARHISNIGEVHLALDNRDSALHEFQKALLMDKEQGNKRSEAINTANIGNMYARVESEFYSPEKAEEYLIRSLELNTELGTKKNLYECHLALASLYEQMNDIAKALYHHKAFHKIKEEVVSEEALHQARLLENRRKIEEAERDRQLKLARLEEQVRILHNILPPSIADRIVSGEKTIAESFENVSIFFSDIVNFTHLSATISPEELVELLNDVFTEFDILARKYHLEKIKTIGDAYMAVCGVPESNPLYAINLAYFALEAQETIKKFSHRTAVPITLRIGLHCGRAVAGVIGENKFAYDLWGDAVNTAARMESYGEPGRVHVSEDFMQAIIQTNHDLALSSVSSLQFVNRGEMEIKGKGMMQTYFLEKV